MSRYQSYRHRSNQDGNNLVDTVDYESVSSSILRGRAALEEAETHIKLFEDFIMESSSKESQSSIQMRHSNNNTHSFDDLTHNNQTITDNFQLNQDNYSLELDLINAMMNQKGEREHRDNNLGVDPIHNLGHSWKRPNSDEMNVIQESTLKRKRHFDPNKLAVARRAVVKDSIIEEEIATREAEQREKANFKARPLPGGYFVNNDPYALTKAALGKVSYGPRDRYKPSISSHVRKDASTLLSRCDTPSQSSRQPLMSPSGSKKGTRNSSIEAKVFYDAISQIVNKKTDTINDDDLDMSSEEEQDLATLHQHISKLQAELNLKRMKCIEAIDNIDREEADAIAFDQEFQSTKNGSSNMEVSNNQTENQIMTSPNDNITPIKRPLKRRNETRNKNEELPLYDRHNLWLERIEMKRKEAKEREEQELLKDFTGKPNLHGATKSWIRAKEQHDGIMKSIKSVESSRRKEREEKERLLREMQLKEIERLKELSKEKKKKTQNSGIAKEMQAVHIDKLSRPNVKIKDKCSDRLKCELVQSKSGFGEQQRQNNLKKDDRNKQSNSKNDGEISFADMNDKEFAKMLRKLKADAGRGKHTIFETDENMEGLGPVSSDKTENEGGVANNVKREGDKIEKSNRFTSSVAQANLLAKLAEVNGDNSKNETSQQKLQRDEGVSNVFHYPYERYEAGEVNFFDRSSSSEIGRFRVRDAREFNADSLRRISALDTSYTSNDGVWFLVGTKKESQTYHVITILFSRSHFDESSAIEWWQVNRSSVLESKNCLVL